VDEVDRCRALTHRRRPDQGLDLVGGLFAEGHGADKRQYLEPGKITLLPEQELIVPGLVFSTMSCNMPVYRFGNPTGSPDSRA